MHRLLLSVGVLALMAPQLEAQARRRQGPSQGTGLAQQISYQQPQPDAALSCACNELQRRLSGLRAVQAIGKVQGFSQRFPAEGQKLSATGSLVSEAVGEGAARLDSAKGKSWADQERICNEAIGATNAAWGEWQGFLSEQGIDSEYFRGVKVDHPTIPSEGDLAEDGPRNCKPGQWWEEDRAWWAISAREGICEQQRHAVKQLLKGQKGDPGHRCYAYELK